MSLDINRILEKASPDPRGAAVHQFNESIDWATILAPHGWRRSGKQWIITREGFDATVAQIVRKGHKEYLKVSDSNTPLECDTEYTRFDVYTLLDHDGDRRSAIIGVAKLLKDEVEELNKFTGSAIATDFLSDRTSGKYIYMPLGTLWPLSSMMNELSAKAVKFIDETRAVHQMTWCPGEEQVIIDKVFVDGAWESRSGHRVFNFYRPPTIELGDAKKAKPWIDHVRLLYPDDLEHLLDWFAHRLQHPEEKCNHAVVLQGSQGIGKDTILVPLKVAVGPWNVKDISPQKLFERFNGYVRSVLLVISEARDLGDVKRFSLYEHTKTLISAPPDVYPVDEKNTPEYYIPNLCGVVFTTNHNDGLYLPPDDRRYFVTMSDAQVASKSTGSFGTLEEQGEYFRRLFRWLEDEGNGHVAAFLHERDITDFDPKAPPPKTAGFWQMVELGRSPEVGEMAGTLDELRWPDALTVSDLTEKASPEFQEWLRNRKNARIIPHRLEDAGYVSVPKEGVKTGQWRVDKSRSMIYAKKDLSYRERYQAATELTSRSEDAHPRGDL